MKTELPKEYYHYRIHHGESGTVYTVFFVSFYVVASIEKLEEKTEYTDLISWNAKDNGLYLAEDFCKRMNLKLGINYQDLKNAIQNSKNQPDSYKKENFRYLIQKYLKETEKN